MSEMNEAGAGCLIMLIMLAVAIGLGGFCVDYVVFTCWGKDLPTWADCCIGLVTAAIVCVIVKACDIETPFFNPQVMTPVTQPAN